MRPLWPSYLIPVEKRPVAHVAAAALLVTVYVLLLTNFHTYGYDSFVGFVVIVAAYGLPQFAKVFWIFSLITSLAVGVTPWVPAAFRNSPCDVLAMVASGLQMAYWWLLAILLVLYALMAGPLAMLGFDQGVGVSALGIILVILLGALLYEAVLLALGYAAACHLAFLWADMRARQLALPVGAPQGSREGVEEGEGEAQRLVGGGGAVALTVGPEPVEGGPGQGLGLGGELDVLVGEAEPVIGWPVGTLKSAKV